jgi:hypothetical protein
MRNAMTDVNVVWMLPPVGNEDFGARVELALKTLSWSQRQLCRQAGIPETNFGVLKKRGGAAKHDTIAKLVDALAAQGFSRSWLMFGEGDPGRDVAKLDAAPPKDWIVLPPVAAEVIQQLQEEGAGSLMELLPVMQTLQFDHEKPPSHFHIYKAMKKALTELAAPGTTPEIEPGETRDPAAKVSKKKAAPAAKRRSKRHE